MAKKRVHTTLTDRNGCTVEIDGEVEYSIIPPRFDGFSGTVTVGGGASCPRGALSFRTRGVHGLGGLSVAFDNKDISKISKITWREITNSLRYSMGAR